MYNIYNTAAGLDKTSGLTAYFCVQKTDKNVKYPKSEI